MSDAHRGEAGDAAEKGPPHAPLSAAPPNDAPLGWLDASDGNPTPSNYGSFTVDAAIGLAQASIHRGVAQSEASNTRLRRFIDSNALISMEDTRPAAGELRGELRSIAEILLSNGEQSTTNMRVAEATLAAIRAAHESAEKSAGLLNRLTKALVGLTIILTLFALVAALLAAAPLWFAFQPK